MASLIAGPSPATCHHVKSFQTATCQRQRSSLSTKAFPSSEKSVSGSFPSVQFFGQKLSLKTNHAATSSAVLSYSRKGQIKAQVERSYVMVKPDGVQRGLVGEIISRFEKKGFTLKGLKLFQCPKELAQEHYKDLSEKPFYGKLVDYIISGPVVAMIWEGKGVVLSARKLIGATNPLSSEPGTIRGDFAIEVGRNVIHGSDSPENGEREIALWFDEDEIVEWSPTLSPWLIE